MIISAHSPGNINRLDPVLNVPEERQVSKIYGWQHRLGIIPHAVWQVRWITHTSMLKDGKIIISLLGMHLGTTFLWCISAPYNPMSPINRIQAANNLLGRAWASPTLVWLHCICACVCSLACLLGPTTYRKSLLALILRGLHHTLYSKTSIVEDMNHGQSSSSMMMTKTETTHGTIQWLER